MQNQLTVSAGTESGKTHNEIPPAHINRDMIAGVGMAMVMIVAMGGWLYGLCWIAWRIVLWLVS